MSADAPRIRATYLLLPKQGSTPEECEDAVGLNMEALRFAVADGATEAFDSGNWARRLAQGWARAGGPPPHEVEEFAKWLAAEGAGLRESWRGRRLPWYAEEKARGGSFAAFVGLGFEASAGRLRWRALALGDACLVQLRDGEIRAALPLESYEGFGSAPPLVPSSESLQEAALRHAVTGEGAARAGDRILLLSDAVAAWFLRFFVERRALLEEFDSLLAASDNVALAALLEEERRACRLKDDDVAAVRVAISPKL